MLKIENKQIKKTTSMKKVFFLLAIAITVTSTSHAQVFNTGTTLKKGSFSAGFEPAFLPDAGGFMLFLHGGYGLKKGIDFGVTLGVLNGEYIGADVEWGLGNYMSIATGFHNWGSFGLDGTLNLTFPIRKDSRIFTGLDVDVNFPGDDVSVPLWIPVGVELGLRSNMAFILEGEIGLTSSAYHLFGGGIVIYL